MVTDSPELSRALDISRATTGWLEDDEARELYRHVLDTGQLGPTLEIGSWHGKSTVILATAARIVGTRVHSVDPHEGINYWQDETAPMPELGPSFADFERNLAEAGAGDVVAIHIMTSRDAFAAMGSASRFGFVFIDGNHGYQHVKSDFESWFTCLEPGGVIALHDSNTRMPGPRRVIAEVRERGDVEYLSLVGQLTSFRKTMP
ncbi:MAG: class I SAM-dependent methyltransferase [Candidatus Latescibacterota bacterium]|nr:class I SAM-dependent methyltransferase [Candidatus Latescibacterota bacterium]